MNREKYEMLQEVIPGKYQVKLRFSNGKLGIDIFRGEKQLKPTTRTFTKTTFVNLYGGKPSTGRMVSKYEIICFLCGVPVLNQEVNTQYVQENIDKIKKYARRILKNE